MWALGGNLSHDESQGYQNVVIWISPYGQAGGEVEEPAGRNLDILGRCLHQAGQLSIHNLHKGEVYVIEGYHPAVNLAA